MVKNRGLNLSLINNTFFLIIFYIIFPSLLRFLSGMFFVKLPIAIGFLLSSYFITLFIIAKKEVKLRKKFFYFLLFQLFIWYYLSLSLTINANINDYPIIYVLASAFSYVLIPVFILLTVVFCLNWAEIKKGKNFISIILIFMVVFIPSLIENIVFYTKGSTFFEFLKEKDLIMSYYIPILNGKFLKTFSIFPSGLDFGFLSLVLYITLNYCSQKHKSFFLALRFLSLLGIVLSFTRVVWITFVLYSFLKMIFKKYKIKLSIIVFLQLFLSIVAFSIIYFSILYISSLDIYFISSIITRLNSWVEIFTFVKDKLQCMNFLFGFGLSQTEVWNPFLGTRYNVFCIDNTFVNLFLLGGFGGIFLFLLNYYMIIKKLLKTYKRENTKYVLDLIILWIIFPVVMNFNVLIPSILFLFLYTNSLYIIGLYNE